MSPPRLTSPGRASAAFGAGSGTSGHSEPASCPQAVERAGTGVGIGASEGPSLAGENPSSRALGPECQTPHREEHEPYRDLVIGQGAGYSLG